MSLSLIRLFRLSFWSQIFQSLINTCQRFPLTIISLLALNFALFTGVHKIDFILERFLIYVFIFGLGGTFWFTASTLLKESLKWNNTKYYLLALPVFFIFCWYATTFDRLVSNSNTQLLIFAAGLCLTFSAWLFRSNNNHSVWYFNYQLISASCFALLSTVILCGGLSLILSSVSYLFEFKIFSKMYYNIWLFGISLLAPIYLLANIPTQFDYQRSECQFPKGVSFILSYVLVPLTLIYIVILYAYFLKIIVQWQLPHGHLGKMISIFGIIGIFTHLAIYPVYDRSSTILSWFYRYFYLIMIVPLLLLSIAIGQRIYQYGVTDIRYIVVICTFWFAFLVFSYLKNRQKFHLKQVTLSLALLILFSSFGPWGIHQLPINSQYSRLESLLIKNRLLINGIIKVHQQPNLETRIAISSIVDYLYKHSAEQKLRLWFKDKQAFDKQLPYKDTEPQHRSGQNIVTLMGIDYVSPWHQRTHSVENSAKVVDSQFNKKSYSVTDYDDFIPLEWMTWNQEYNQHITLFKGDAHKTNITIRINDQGHLVLSSAEGELLSFNLEKVINQFSGFHTQIAAEEAEKMIVRQVSDQLEGKLYIHHLERKTIDGKIKFRHLTGGLLLKVKD